MLRVDLSDVGCLYNTMSGFRTTALIATSGVDDFISFDKPDFIICTACGEVVSDAALVGMDSSPNSLHFFRVCHLDKIDMGGAAISKFAFCHKNTQNGKIHAIYFQCVGKFNAVP